ncbi:hypothetical protein [Hugenholtzia roseola]|uniref:hypothetical protein n=1 Tax=Hugenholtzia roseola TaxID=1002 RepID=UPI0004276EAC|nr:hypothetical protein [Hugenholtzia roseola]
MGTIQYDIEKDDLYLQGLEKGERVGELKVRRELAISCLKDRLSVEKTAKLTKLSIEEVRKLSKEL